MRRPSLLTLACLTGLVILAARAWRERVPPPIPATTPPTALLAPAPVHSPLIATGESARVSAPPAMPPAPVAPTAVAPTNAPAPVAPTNVAALVETTPAAGTVKLESAQLERLVTGPGVADMRMLTLALRVDPRGAPVQGEDVRVHTRFFVQDSLSRAVTLAEAAETELTLRGRLEPDQLITLTRPFVLTAPAPDAETGSSTRAFHGFRVDVYFQDRLIGTEARPPSLAQP